MPGKAFLKAAQEDATDVERKWYVPPRPEMPRGWLVYTLDFLLATMQGCVAEPEKVRRTTSWLILGTIVRCCMVVAQALIMLLAWIPIISSLMETVSRVFTRNAAGFFLRACYYKAKLQYLGQDTIIDQYVDIWGAGSVCIGSHCHIDTHVRLAAGEQRHGQHGSVRIGNHVHLGPGVHIAGRGVVEIHDMVGISANAHIYSATNVVELPSDPGRLISMSHIAPHDRQHIIEAPVVIEEYAFIGMMARIMPGVRVGRAAIIHANAHLTRSVQPFANVGGVPSGRQIGWRQPRRSSPMLAARPVQEIHAEVAEEGAPDIPRIREVLDPNDWRTIEDVVKLHNEAFQEGVTTQLGQAFMCYYYRAMISSGDSSLWVAELNGSVVGFLGCTLDRRGFERANRSGKTRFLAAWRFCTLRLSPYAVMRALRKQHRSRDFEDEAELLSIVVAPSARRIGLGKRFLDVWTKKLQTIPVSSYIVFTDNPEGLSFYQKYGGECLFRFQLHSLASACFRLKVPPAEPASQDAGGRSAEAVSDMPRDGS